MTHRLLSLASLVSLPVALAACAVDEGTGDETTTPLPFADHPALQLTAADVAYEPSLDAIVFSMEVVGDAGSARPTAAGGLEGAPVLGYVFPTTLPPARVGFGDVEGTLALAVTSHPDFDDTPLWDEDLDRDYGNDGVIFHSHWVVLVPDSRVAGGLKVKEFTAGDPAVVLPPTNPGMPMYMDSPGFSVLLQGDTLKVLVPAQRVSGKTDFRFDAVAAYMQVAQSGDRPLLGVYEVYSVLSGDLSLPYSVSR